MLFSVASPFINKWLNSLGKQEVDRPIGKYMNSSLAMNVILYHIAKYACVISYVCAQDLAHRGPFAGFLSSFSSSVIFYTMPSCHHRVV